MPRLIPIETEEVIGLEEFVAGLEDAGFDPACEESLAAMVPLLRRLANNRSFLADILIRELKDRCAGQERTNGYGAQVIMLHRAEHWFVRANLWLAAEDAVVRASGLAPFFYGIAHDHNFSFLTAGYFGPGYWSDYYEYDAASVRGVPGEKVALRFVERSQLSPGKLMLYRAHRDVHQQYPPERLSVSLNLMQALPGQAYRDQYRFDIERGEIEAAIGHRPAEALLALLPDLGGEEGLDLLERFARGHPSNRIRFGSIAALASAAPDLDGRVAMLERGAADRDPYVVGMCRNRIAAIEAGRDWIGA